LIEEKRHDITVTMPAGTSLDGTNAAARLKVREMHPEVCFWGLSEGNPMRHAKGTRDGVEERIAVLQDEIARLEAARAKKQASRFAADQFFKR
jgi:predicted RNase H-like nuclease